MKSHILCINPYTKQSIQLISLVSKTNELRCQRKSLQIQKKAAITISVIFAEFPSMTLS